MAKELHLSILGQGVEAWNRWRQENPRMIPDLRRAELSRTDLYRVNLSRARLSGIDLYRANLAGADLYQSNLGGADLREANLSDANLGGVLLGSANLCGAVLSRANLDGADLSNAQIGWTTFGDNDLRPVGGLETVVHRGPSTIGVDTIYRSKGDIPWAFLRGAGVPEELITYVTTLADPAFEFKPYLISCAAGDEVFARRLYTDLQREGVRCWFVSEEMKLGERVRRTVGEAIRSYHRLVLVLSQHSVNSGWIAQEVGAAQEEERRRSQESGSSQTVLVPVRLDSTILSTHWGWAAEIRRTRQIEDFTQWRDQNAYQKTFERFLHDL